ncbi:MAG TPA: DUF423 domain-containing protein [Mucilaginibacter sp.]
MKKRIFITAAITGALAVIMGAFGAHALQGILKPKDLEVWHTGVQYQFYHTAALLGLSSLSRHKTRLVKDAYYLFLIGIIFFSGSLYLLACQAQLGIGWLPLIGPVTPLGGLLLIGGWITMGIAATKSRS